MKSNPTMWAIIQPCDYGIFPNGINPYHVEKSKERACSVAEMYFRHAPYEVREVLVSEIPKIKEKSVERGDTIDMVKP